MPGTKCDQPRRGGSEDPYGYAGLARGPRNSPARPSRSVRIHRMGGCAEMDGTFASATPRRRRRSVHQRGASVPPDSHTDGEYTSGGHPLGCPPEVCDFQPRRSEPDVSRGAYFSSAASEDSSAVSASASTASASTAASSAGASSTTSASTGASSAGAAAAAVACSASFTVACLGE